MKLVQKKKVAENADYAKPRVDELSKLADLGFVVPAHDCEDDYYNVTLTITDCAYGYYGRHDFYRMQVIHNTVQVCL